nr:helix-turn-helix domain-containing protein [Verrucomicrobium spinosum]
MGPQHRQPGEPLRRKIEPDSKNPTLIKTHWGDGYCFTGKAVVE